MNIDIGKLGVPLKPLPTWDELNKELYITNRQLKGMKEKTNNQQAELILLERELNFYKSIPESIEYRLGKIILNIGKSPSTLLRLPKDLLQLHKLSKINSEKFHNSK